jgi:hypothetical protein
MTPAAQVPTDPLQMILPERAQLGTVMAQAGRFDIPLNQRAWSWTGTQLRRLWDDTLLTLESFFEQDSSTERDSILNSGRALAEKCAEPAHPGLPHRLLIRPPACVQGHLECGSTRTHIPRACGARASTCSPLRRTRSTLLDAIVEPCQPRIEILGIKDAKSGEKAARAAREKFEPYGLAARRWPVRGDSWICQ